MPTARNKRPAYKPLYLAAEARARTEKSRADVLRQELVRLRGVLAPVGFHLATTRLERESQMGLTALTLTPLDYECVRAWMHSTARFTDGDFFNSFENLAFRGIPLMRTEGRNE